MGYGFIIRIGVCVVNGIISAKSPDSPDALHKKTASDSSLFRTRLNMLTAFMVIWYYLG